MSRFGWISIPFCLKGRVRLLGYPLGINIPVCLQASIDMLAYLDYSQA